MNRKQFIFTLVCAIILQWIGLSFIYTTFYNFNLSQSLSISGLAVGVGGSIILIVFGVLAFYERLGMRRFVAEVIKPKKNGNKSQVSDEKDWK